MEINNELIQEISQKLFSEEAKSLKREERRQEKLQKSMEKLPPAQKYPIDYFNYIQSLGNKTPQQ